MVYVAPATTVGAISISNIYQNYRQASLPKNPRQEESRTEKQAESYITRLNSDCLSEIFLHLAKIPLTTPPKFSNSPKDTKHNVSTSPFLDITSQSHQNLHLLTCCLVSRQWYETARRLLWHTLVVRTRDYNTWYERLGVKSADTSVTIPNPASVASLTSSPGNWVRNLTVIGGNANVDVAGEKPNTPNQIHRMLQLFPCIQELTVFGMGWGTSGMFAPDQLNALAMSGTLANIKKLNITGTSEYLLKGAPVGRNWTEIMGLLVRLPNLRSLKLHGLTFRAQLTVEQKQSAPCFELEELKLGDCQLSYESFEWLVGGSVETLETLEMPNTNIWKDKIIAPILPMAISKEIQTEKERRKENDKDSVVTEAEKRLGVMEKRLGVDLPIFEMRRKS